MTTVKKTPVSPETAYGLRTLRIASRATASHSYSRPFRTLFAIIPDELSHGVDGFLVEETLTPDAQATENRSSAFYRLDSFEDASEAFAAPLLG